MKSGTKQGCLLSPPIFTKVLEALVVITVRPEREIKDLQIRTEETKPSLFANNMILYIENFKESSKNS